MQSRSSDARTGRRTRVQPYRAVRSFPDRFWTSRLPRLAAVALLAAFAMAPAAAQDAKRTAQRAAERIKELLQEADALAAQQSRLLVELEKLDRERRERTAELRRIEEELADARRALADSTARAEALRQETDRQRPDIEARLVELYKLGRMGHWRLLLDVQDVQSLGRAYRTAAAMTAIDRARIEDYRTTLAALEAEQKELETRTTTLARLHADAQRARAQADRAVAAHVQLVDAIDARRDLNAQMAGELQAVQQRLEASLREATNGSSSIDLPLRAFRGALSWPAPGPVRQRFGGTPGRNGIEIGVAPGQRVAAVHEGTVAYADQFTGYGTLVIIEHEGGAYTLYGYLESTQVARGQHVESGTSLGMAGHNPSGNPALYFELRVDGRPVDPLQWLQKGNP